MRPPGRPINAPPGMGVPHGLQPGMSPPGMNLPPVPGMPMPPGMQHPPGIMQHGMMPPGVMPPGMMPPGVMPPPGIMPMPPGMQHPTGMMPPLSGLPPGMPPPSLHQRPEAFGQPPLKRPRIDPNTQRIHEQEWLESHPGPVIIMVQVPDMPEKKNWHLKGQTIRVTALMSDNIRTVKQMVGEALGGLPHNKQNLKFKANFWKDKKSLAYYNAESGMSLDLSLKSRGGKKK